MAVTGAVPALPAGRTVDLPGRGTTFVREVAGPPGAPTVVLLHGLTASTDLNWFESFAALGRHVRVVAVENRGYGRGLPASGAFRLEDCADDVVAVADALGVDRFVAVGYSLGGAVAQLVWRRHPDRVCGLVLCATSRAFLETVRETVLWRALPVWIAVVRAVPVVGRRFVGATLVARFDGSPWQEWAAAELRRAAPAHMLSGARALGAFSSVPWIGAVDVPVAVVVTRGDILVPPARQRALAAAVPGATTHEIDADHGA
ncbi:MAG: alpha/beta fold hydrolase, partial [Acidimicrobiales bacterium]